MIEWDKHRVLVTGGTGSFGNFIVRRLLELRAKEVRVLSRDEKKQHDMRVYYEARSDLTLLVGDIRSRESVDEAMKGISIVFQAAALKQVPTCERFPAEALQTNVAGVDNVVQSALFHGVERFVCISTDKAVKPVNVMGMTKALQERLVLRGNSSPANHGTRLACIRYGNVLRSRGSVVPLFRAQLSRGRRLTITDPRMTRFLLTLGDAIDLVLFAADTVEGGEVFVRKAPAATIVDIARAVSEEVGKELEYETIGILPGEKLNEILVSEEELERTEDCGDYYRVYPWWSAARPRALSRELCSGECLVGLAQVRDMIRRADQEFAAMEISGGEYANF